MATEHQSRLPRWLVGLLRSPSAFLMLLYFAIGVGCVLTWRWSMFGIAVFFFGKAYMKFAIRGIKLEDEESCSLQLPRAMKGMGRAYLLGALFFGLASVSGEGLTWLIAAFLFVSLGLVYYFGSKLNTQKVPPWLA